MNRSHALALVLTLAAIGPGCRDQTTPAVSPTPQTTTTAEDELPRPPFADVVKTNPIDFAPRPKVVLFVVVDTLRADHLGCYGDDRKLTPVIDQFAGASYVFSNASATSSWTKSSVASMFTSRYPGSLNVLGRDDLLTEDNLTLAEALTSSGGFDCLGIYANGNVSSKFGFMQGFKRYIMPPHHARTGYEGDYLVHPAQAVTEFALLQFAEFLIRRPRTDAPTLLFVHYVDPHDPYLPHPEMMSRPEPPGRFDGSRAALRELDRTELTAEDMDRIKWLYEGEVRYCDHWIGRLIKGLGGILGSLDDVMLVLTADHGEGLWDHEFRAHGRDLYEEQTHVPLIVRFPGQRDGRVIETPVSLVDIAPTILEACRIPKPSDWQGFDLKPVIDGEARARGFDYVYSELRLSSFDFEAIRTADQKVIRNRSMKFGDVAGYERYDLETDPGEQNNLFRTARDAKTDLHFRDVLEEYSEVVRSAAKGGGKVDYAELDEATLENLRALGYIGDDEFEDAKSRRDKRKATSRSPDEDD